MTDQRETLPQLAVMVPTDLKRQSGARREWIEGSYNLCIHLNAARRQHKGNTAFGKWCSDNGFGEDELDENGKHVLNADTRAAAVAMGADPEALRDCLEATERSSVLQVYRSEFNETRLRYVSKTSSGKEEEMVKDGSQKQRIIELYEKAGAEGISSPEVVAELGIPSKSVGRSLSELKTEGVLVATNMMHGKAVVLVHRDFVTEGMLQPPEEGKKASKKRRKLEPLNRYSRPLVPSSKVTLEEAGFPVHDPHGIDPETGLPNAHAFVRKWGHGTGVPFKTRVLMEDHKNVVHVAPRMRDMTKLMETWAGVCATAYLRTPKEQADPIVPMPPEKFMAAVREVESGPRALERVKEAGPKFLEAAAIFQAQLDQVVAHVKAIMAAVNEAPPVVEASPEGGAEIIELNSVRT